jgi:hypothetical protein
MSFVASATVEGSIVTDATSNLITSPEPGLRRPG